MRRSKSRKLANVFFAGLLATAASGLSGCSMDTPTYFSQKRVEVIESVRHIEVPTAQIDDQVISSIASDYFDHGDGPLKLVVTYNPAVRGNSAMMASDNAARIAGSLRRQNIKNIETEILPVHNSVASLTLLDFASFEAIAPQGCTDLERIDDSAHENYRDYQLGCATETYLARQIARPKDLLGREGDEELEDGRKRANVIEAYKSTIQNERLEVERPTE